MQIEDITRLRDQDKTQDSMFHEKKQQSLIASINSLLKRVTITPARRGTQLLEKIEFEIQKYLKQ